MNQSGKQVGNFRYSFASGITSVLIIFFLAATTQAQSLIPQLSFKNPVLQTGKGNAGDGLDGAVYLFENVGWEMDALVVISGRSSIEVRLSAMDVNGPDPDSTKGTGSDDAWQPMVVFADGTAPAHQTWWMEFKVSFVKHDAKHTPVDVHQFFVSGLDIDGDGNQLHEFQAYYKMKSSAHQSGVFASSVMGAESDPLLRGKRFDGTPKNYNGISLSAADAMVSNLYTGSSSMIVRLGAETGTAGTVAANRMYGLLFKSLAFDVPEATPLPVNLVAMN